MRKRLAVATAAAALLLLTGCVSTAEDPTSPAPPALSGDQQDVADLALADKADAREQSGQTAAVVGVYEWREGYSVLIRTDGKNDDGPYTNWEAYGFVPANGDWALDHKALAFTDEVPVTTLPERATCLVLAEGSEEKDACSLLEK